MKNFCPLSFIHIRVNLTRVDRKCRFISLFHVRPTFFCQKSNTA